MTKGGIHTFARSLSAHLLDRGIRVNVITPAVDPLDASRPPSRWPSSERKRTIEPPRNPKRSRPPTSSWRRRPARASSPAIVDPQQLERVEAPPEKPVPDELCGASD